MIPFHKGHSAVSAPALAALLFRLAVACPHFLGANLTANRAFFRSEKAFAIRTFVKIRSVKFVNLCERTQKSAHSKLSFLKNMNFGSFFRVLREKRFPFVPRFSFLFPRFKFLAATDFNYINSLIFAIASPMGTFTLTLLSRVAISISPLSIFLGLTIALTGTPKRSASENIKPAETGLSS